MFPSTHKNHKMSFVDQSSPHSLASNRIQAQKSAHLPYFKRFPKNKILSLQKKKTSIQNILTDKSKKIQIKNKKIRFFTEEKRKEQEQQNPLQYMLGKNLIGQSNKNTRYLKHGQKLLKQIYQRQNTKLRSLSDHQEFSTSKNSPLKIETNHHILNKSFTPEQILSGSNNLTKHEESQIFNHERIYYYGQKCLHKKNLTNNKNNGYPWTLGDHVQYRYEFISLIGEGSFGEVFKCFDHKNSCQIALKIVKNNDKFTKQAKIQIRILNLLKSKDPLSVNNCIEIKDFFSWRNQVCMVFPLISINLYELIKKNSYYGLPLDLVRRFVLQILNAIHYIHKNRIIHADLKPQNILLKQQNKSGIKIIDFGSSCFENQLLYTYIQSRYYRAPQIILGISYNHKIDIWSFGCIIAQLHLGFPIFAGQDEFQQIVFFIQVLGYPPQRLSRNSKRWQIFFKNDNQLIHKPKNFQPYGKTLQNVLENPYDLRFVQFIRLCLKWDPCQRISALQCLKHQWVLQNLPLDFKHKHLQFIHQQEQKIKNTKKISLSLQNKKRLI